MSEDTEQTTKLFQLTSSWTMGLRLFIPTLWLTFFGVMILAAFFSEDAINVGIFSVPYSKYILLLFWILSLIFFLFTLLRLRRLDGDEFFMYVSTYFRNFRYPHHNIEKLTVKEYGIFYIGKLYFKQAGTLGNSVFCILSKGRLEAFVAYYPNIKTDWKVEE